MTDDVPRLLKLAEVAAMFRVHRATVARWKGLSVVRTPGGDRRYLYDEVLAYLDFGTAPMNVPPGAGEEPPPDGIPRPASAGQPPAEAMAPAGRQGDAGVPGQFGGLPDAGPCIAATPRAEKACSDE